MQAPELYELTNRAIAVTGSPRWPAPETTGQFEGLRFVPADRDEPASWVMMSLGAEELPATGDNAGPESLFALEASAVDWDEAVQVDAVLAAQIIREHLRSHLAAMGWQVQMKMSRGKATWRLADCLAITEGGGDRLDDHYPSGDDELAVLCDSVVVLARHGMG
jgi:hypothetical protein